MTTPAILLSLISFATLLLGIYAWQLTSSRPLIVNMLFASAAFLIAAYAIVIKQPGELRFVIPFLASMLIAGRAVGTYWRVFVKGETALRVPSHLVGAAALLSIAGAVVAFVNM